MMQGLTCQQEMARTCGLANNKHLREAKDAWPNSQEKRKSRKTLSTCKFSYRGTGNTRTGRLVVIKVMGKSEVLPTGDLGRRSGHANSQAANYKSAC